jgi:fibronectin type 3 domain-containing protein
LAGDARRRGPSGIRHEEDSVMRGSTGHGGSSFRRWVRPSGVLASCLFLAGGSAVAAPRAAANGDVDGNGTVDAGDVLHLLAHLFQGGPAPVPIECAFGAALQENGDVDASGAIDLSDGLCLIAWLHLGGRAPAPACPAGEEPDGGGASPTLGAWSAVQTWPIVSVHTQMLPTGNVMFYPYSDGPRLWNPATAAVSSLANAGYNLFCSGHSLIGDGRLLVTGGHIANNNGLPNTSYYDAFTNTWTPLANMNDGRWYPTNTTLANGDVLVVSGDRSAGGNNTLPQVWQVGSASYRDLTSAVLGLPLYPKMFLAPNGRVFFAGNTSRYLDTAGAGAWTTVANRLNSGRDNYGSAALYDHGKVVFIGGADPPTATAEVIDLNAATPAWRAVGSMAQPRRHHNVTLLPDGTLLVTGGSSGAGFNNSATPVHAAELWNPATEQFTALASSTRYRGYHSTALLLPDGRVLSSGGDGEPNAEVYSPTYLFKGARPTISSAPATVSYGAGFFVGTPDGPGIAQVTWIRLSTVTHTHNMDQRFSRLSFTSAGGGLQVTAPSNPNLSPPGHYMLFILNANLVPSVARIIRIGGFGSPPPAPTGLTATPGPSRVNLGWTAAATATGYNVKRATVSGGPYSVIAANHPSTTYSDTGRTPGTTYHYVVSAVNPAGESPNSSQASATPIAGGTGTGLEGDYYDNIDFTAFTLSRIDPTVNFDWGSGSPAPAIGADTFSVAWTGQLEPLFTQTYTLYTISDDGVRLRLGGQLVIDNWTDHGPTENSAAVSLIANQRYDIRMEFYENGGGAVAQLHWSSPSTAREAVPQSQLYPPLPPPGPPTDLAAAGGDSRVTLTWNPPGSGAASYNVKRGTASGGPYATIATGIAGTTYTDTTAVNGTTYYYVVSSVSVGGEGPNSNEASATPRPAPPAPTGLTTVAGDAQVNLSWNAAAGATSYYVQRANTSGGPYATIAFQLAATSFLDSGLTNGTTYYYVVYASNSSGSSPLSNEAAATPQAAGPGAFQQSAAADGIVAMEAENFDGLVSQGNHNWVAVTAPAGFSGSGARRAEPDNGTLQDTGYVTASPRLDYRVNFVRTGTHYVWIRGSRADGSDDSCHAGIDGAANTTADRISNFPSANAWSWTGTTMDATSRATIQVASTGLHTVNIWMREDGFRIDKIVLTTSSAFTPSGTGPAQSPRGGDATPPAAPSGLTAAPAGSAINLDWNNNAEADLGGYRVHRATTSGGPYAAVSGLLAASAYSDAAVVGGVTYFYVVTAVDTSSNESATSNQASATAPATFNVIVEAETAVLSGVQVSAIHAGYTGTGFGDYINPTADYIQWTVNAPAAGTYTLQVRYALATGSRPLEIRVNGLVVVASQPFPATGAFTTWGNSTLTANLNAGANTVRATAIGSSGANVDHLRVID